MPTSTPYEMQPVPSSGHAATDQQAGTFFLRISMPGLRTAVSNFLRNHHSLHGKSLVLEFFGDPNWHNIHPTLNPDWPDQLQEVIQADDLTNKPEMAELYADIQKGVHEASVAIILLIAVNFCEKIHLHFGTGCFLHHFPIFSNLFHDPKTSMVTGYKTWPRPTAWEKTYWPVILGALAPRLQTLELNMTWTMGSIISHPPFKTMIPISRLPRFTGLERLVMPYFAVVPRPRTCASVFPTSALPASLVELVVVEAYPSRPLLDWLRDVRAERRRLKKFEMVEVRFDDSYVRRSYDALVSEFGANGGYLTYDPPVFMMTMGKKDEK